MMACSTIDIALRVPDADVADVDAFFARVAQAFTRVHTKGVNIQQFYIAKGAARVNAMDAASGTSGFTEYYMYEEYADVASAKAHFEKFQNEPIFKEFEEVIMPKYGACFKAVKTGRDDFVLQSWNGLVPEHSPVVGETPFVAEFIVDKAKEEHYDELFTSHQRFVQVTSSFTPKGTFEPRITQYNIMKANEGADKIAYTMHMVFPGGDVAVNKHMLCQKLDWKLGAMEQFLALVNSGSFALMGNARIIHAM